MGIAEINLILPVIFACLGYFFKEYRNRAKPFVEITSIYGLITRNLKRVELSDDAIENTKKSIFLKTLTRYETLQNIRETKKTCSEIIDMWKDFDESINQLILAIETNNEKVCIDNLSQILSNELYSNTISKMINWNVVNIPKPLKKESEKIAAYNSEYYNGCVLLDFKGTIGWVGFNFKDFEIAKIRHENIIDLIKYLDYKGLSEAFRSIQSYAEKEYSIANSITTELTFKHDQNSHWEFRIYMANIGKTPLLVSTDSFVIIEDKPSGAFFKEKCKLVLLSYDKEGGLTRDDSDVPVIIEAEKSKVFSFVTEKNQSEIKQGNVIRGLFDSKTAVCHLEFEIQKVGIVRIKLIKTPKVAFK